MKGLVTVLFVTFFSFSALAFENEYKATTDWYESINGFKTIFFQIEDERDYVAFKGSPWFSGDIRFKVISEDEKKLIALSEDEATLFVLDYETMLIKAGDHMGGYLQFGKYLTADFEEIR